MDKPPSVFDKCGSKNMDNKLLKKEILRAMILSSYKNNIISLKEYTEMIKELDKK